MSQEEEEYQPKDTIASTVRAASITATGGLFVASVQATLTRHNIGLLGAFTRHGGTIAVFGAMGASYEFFRLSAANLRQKNDHLNQAIGGFASGMMMGIQRRTMPAVLGYGALVSVVMTAFSATGGSLSGFKRDAAVDEYERKLALRANKRRPIGETLSELGEGRGIYGPGYDERRRERVKQAYGIDVPPAPK